MSEEELAEFITRGLQERESVAVPVSAPADVLALGQDVTSLSISEVQRFARRNGWQISHGAVASAITFYRLNATTTGGK